MALEQRDYMREDYEPGAGYGGPRRSFGRGMPVASITTWLIVINVGVFLFDMTFGRAAEPVRIFRIDPETGMRQLVDVMTPIQWWGHFSAYTAIQHLQLWRFITFQFLHASFTHILFNMIALFFFGPLVEQYLGRARYLAFYLLCGVAGAVSYLLLWMAHVLVADPWVPLVGASAGIFGVLIAGARVAPDATVLIYGILPMRLKTMAWVFVGIAVWTVFTGGHNAGGEAAHLGGAVLGYALMSYPRVLNIFDPRALRHARMRYRG